METLRTLLAMCLLSMAVEGAHYAEASEYTMEPLEARVACLEGKLHEMKGCLDVCKAKSVSFGATLGMEKNVGPYNVDKRLVFKNLFANTGCYNADTGVFEAPVEGYYMFSFNIQSFSMRDMMVQLMRNNQKIVSVRTPFQRHRHESAGNNILLCLEAKEHVYLSLVRNNWVYDAKTNLSTFSGFLVKPEPCT